MIFVKMALMTSGSNSVYAITLKCLVARAVMLLLPPPGGPIAPNKSKLSNLTNCKSYLLYHPWWSRIYLNNSIGGWAPNVSFLGIFRSSTNMTYLFPTGGPLTPFLRLSIHESIVS